MSTYLRAHGVSVRFHHQVGRHGLDEGSDRLGGVVTLQRRHGYIQAVDGISLSLRDGDRLAVVGHNGSGKSTLLRTLAGIYPPQAGRIECNGRIASLFNISLGFRQEASGYRNIILKGLAEGRSNAEIARAIPEIVAFSGLGPYIDMPLRTYSQGMAMRLAFSIATSFHNDILLMDEWIGAGDAAFREKVVGRMNNYVQAASIVVIASHSAVLLKRIANKAIWLESGKLRGMGDVGEVVDAYERDALAPRMLESSRLPIDLESIDFRLQDGEQRGDGKITWDVTGSGIDMVNIYLVRKPGDEVCFASGGSLGSRTIKAWLRPGLTFRLEEAGSRRVLGSVSTESPAG